MASYEDLDNHFYDDYYPWLGLSIILYEASSESLFDTIEDIRIFTFWENKNYLRERPSLVEARVRVLEMVEETAGRLWFPVPSGYRS